jgi:hypothetical protein
VEIAERGDDLSSLRIKKKYIKMRTIKPVKVIVEHSQAETYQPKDYLADIQ